MSETVELKYGKGSVKLEVPNGSIIATLYPNKVERAPDDVSEIERAVANPIGSPLLEELARGKRTAVIVVPDVTRPLPRAKMLAPLLERLHAAGIPDSAITIIFGLGTHRAHSAEERLNLVGPEIHQRIRCIDHDMEQCVRLGVTSRGTPVEVSKEYLQAELKLSIGEVELHYYAGYTGGAKAVLPGVSSKESVQENHKMMLMPGAASGVSEGNPVREDMEEAAKMAGLDFTLCAVLDESGEAMQAFAGDFIAAHRRAAAVVDKAFKVRIPKKADIVLVSSGGFPKDINLYQAGKAIENAKYAVRDGGTMIVFAECAEGIGHKVFQQWIEEATTPQDVIDRLKRQFVFGGHKAVALGRLAGVAETYLVSAMGREQVEKAFMKHSPSGQETLDMAIAKHGPKPSVIVLPLGNITLPVLQ